MPLTVGCDNQRDNPLVMIVTQKPFAKRLHDFNKIDIIWHLGAPEIQKGPEPHAMDCRVRQTNVTQKLVAKMAP